MKFVNINNLIILFFSTLLVLIKYIVSYFLNYEEDFFFKILRLSYEDFESYALLVESFSRLDLTTDWSNILRSNNLIGFPFLSLIWHAIFFNLFSYYVFIIFEIVFYFLLLFFIFKIFFLIYKSYKIAFFSLILLLLGIELLTFLSSLNVLNISKVKLFYALLLPLNESYGQRFPHPLVTSVYLFFFIYVVSKINESNDLFIKPKYFFFLGIISIFLLNSFFFHFIQVSIFLIIFFVLKYKSFYFNFLKINIFNLVIYLLLVAIGFLILLLLLHFSEPDYFYRLGGMKINLTEKIVILQVLIKKLFQLEMLLIIFLCFLARYNYTKIKIEKKDIFNFDLLYVFFLASLLSPYFFVAFTSKITHLYHFWTTIKFSGFLFIFVVIIKIFFNFKFNISIKKLSIFLCTILLVLNFYNNFFKQINTNYQMVKDRNDIKLFLIDRNFINTKKTLFSDDYAVMHLWLKLKNNYLIVIDGFVSSYSDELLENIIFNYLKITGVSSLAFENMLIQYEDSEEFNRNNFAQAFTNKYSVNSIRHKKPIEIEYSSRLKNRIMQTSPLILWHTFISKSEKNRLSKKYNNFKLNKKIMPNIVILKNSSINKILKESLKSLNYEETFSNQSFFVNELMQ